MVIPPDEPAADVLMPSPRSRDADECIHCVALLRRRVLRGWGACPRRHVDTWYDYRDAAGGESGRAAKYCNSGDGTQNGEWPSGLLEEGDFD